MTIAWTAMTFFHRFFKIAEPGSVPPYLFATTCVYVASKTTERVSADSARRVLRFNLCLFLFLQPMSIRDAINSYYCIAYPNTPPLEISTEYWKLREAIVVEEQQLLRALRFNLEVQCPYVFLLNYAKTFGFSPETLRCAWGLCNDCMLSDTCIRFSSHVLAVASLFIAGRLLGTEPSNSQDKSKKWSIVCDVTDGQLNLAVADLMAPYVDSLANSSSDPSTNKLTRAI
jgi:hypothetical protein